MKKITTLLVLSILLTGCVVTSKSDSKIPGAEKADFYFIKDISINEGKTFIELDGVRWLSSIDGTCSNPPEVTADLPQCNSNGFLLENSSLETETYEVSPVSILQTTNLGTIPEGVSIKVQDFANSFKENMEYYQSAPFTILIEDDMVILIQEKYLS